MIILNTNSNCDNFRKLHKLFIFIFSPLISVSRLHERWLKDCSLYRELYEPLNEVELQPRINWALVLNQKQVRKHMNMHTKKKRKGLIIYFCFNN